MTTERFDVLVIGAGPGGYVCAIRAAQLGRSVAIVECRATLGGTCLNIGCIPSKALLHASHALAEAQHNFAAMGIDVSPQLDLARMMAFKDRGVAGNVQGVAYLMKKNKITVITGVAKLQRGGGVIVATEAGERSLEADAIIIATGSTAIDLPGIVPDETRILTSTGALSLSQVPEHLLVVGAGVIGLEIGSVWSRLGAKVTIVEYADRILPGIDAEIGKAFQRILEKQGLVFSLQWKLAALNADGTNLVAHTEPVGGGEGMQFPVSHVLIAVGRRPNTEGLGAVEAGLELDDRGRIVTDAGFATSLPGIYAIGDVIAGPMLAHKAEEEGIALAERLAGSNTEVNHAVIPTVVYTAPEVAAVGETEDELAARGIAVRIGKFPFLANGRAKVNGTTDGFVKIIADAKTDRVLGVHIVGPDAGTLIAEAALLMEFGGSAEDLARTCHAHPTLSEAVKEAALAVEGRALHI